MPPLFLAAVIVLVAATSAVRLDARQDVDRDQLKVGVQPDGRVVVPTNQILEPAGKQVAFPGRPVALALIDGGKTLVVMSMHKLLFIDPINGTIKETLPTPGRGKDRAGFSVVGLAVHGGAIYASGADGRVRVARRGIDGHYRWDEPFTLTGTPGVADPNQRKEYALPAGMAFVDGTLVVAANRANVVQVFDLATRKLLQTIPVGVAPYGVVAPRADKAYVSNWGGDPPQPAIPSGSLPARRSTRTAGPISPIAAVSRCSKSTRPAGRLSNRSPSACTPAA